MTAWLMVRAEVAEGDRAAFDEWYETEHLPDAKRAFGARSAWRGWSDVTPGVHLAFYELADLAAVRAVLASDAMKGLVADFDRAFPTVSRSREVVEVRQAL
jgi:hypothetical protein